MKKKLVMMMLVASMALFAGCANEDEAIRVDETTPESQEQSETQKTEAPEKAKSVLLSTTIGPVDAGLIDALIEAYTDENPNTTVRYLARGTGKAIELAEGGNIDMLIVHAKSMEEAFVEEGYGSERIDFMYNDYVIVGPSEDPAGVKDAPNTISAMSAIENERAPFVSRADQSGTNVKELEVWAEAGIQPDGDWYEQYAKGSDGNKATLLYTDEQSAYTIIDRASFISNKKDLKNVEILYEGDDILYNYITIIPVSDKAFDQIHSEEAADFIDWLTSEKAQNLIAEFGVEEYGEALFFANAEGFKTDEKATKNKENSLEKEENSKKTTANSA